MTTGTLLKKFSRNLRSLREKAGLSQGSLSQRAGISVSYISMLERELRSPPLPTLEALGRALRIDPLDLLR